MGILNALREECVALSEECAVLRQERDVLKEECDALIKHSEWVESALDGENKQNDYLMGCIQFLLDHANLWPNGEFTMPDGTTFKKVGYDTLEIS